MKATNKNPFKSFNPQAKNAALLLNRNTRIAEYAYYKSESRGFEPGHELEDWLEAERQFEQQTVLFQSGDYYSLSI
jgi:Protein of unknown function (DUF2934)